jgi:sulfatase modifying factor 1
MCLLRNGTCDTDLICSGDNLCIPADCADGTMDCPCYPNGTCNDGLVCDANVCVPDPTGDGDGDPTGDGDDDPTGDGDGDPTGDGDGDGDPTGDGDGDGDGDADPCAGAPDDMVCVPAGMFQMGTDLQDFLGEMIPADERPAHEITLTQTYWIDRTEVTAMAYAECVAAQACSVPAPVENSTWQVPGKESHPINGVTWFQAVEYCEWKGRRLPSEAEWEYAARGDDGRLFPWGNEAPTCERIVAQGCNPNGTQPVGSKPMGASPVGALDMVGNVYEWCADYYQANYYSISPVDDPPGPMNGFARSSRSAVYFGYPLVNFARATLRQYGDPSMVYQGAGIRCAQTAE